MVIAGWSSDEQLAKRKAEELEDFGGQSLSSDPVLKAHPSDDTAQNAISKFSKTETDEGTRVVKSFLDEWKARTADSSAMNEDDQVAELRKVAEEYQEKFAASPWIQGLLESF